MEIAVVGDTTKGLSKLVNEGLKQRIPNGSKVESFDIYDYSKAALLKYNPDLILFALHQNNLFEPSDAPLSERKPTKAVEAIWELLDSSIDKPIHVAKLESLDNHNGLTALDVLAYALSGISGVWEVGVSFLDTPPKREFNWDHLKVYWRQRRVFLYGHQLKDRFFSFYNLILSEPWPYHEEDDRKPPNDSVKLACFQLALGIAGLSDKELKLFTETGQTLKNLGEYLAKLKDQTGCYLAESVLEKHLGRLESGWRRRFPEYDKKKRYEMPFWARADGFPNQAPFVRNQNVHYTSEILFEALDRLDFARDWGTKNEDVSTTIGVSMPPQYRR